MMTIHRYWTGAGPPAGEPFNGRVQRQMHEGRVHDWTDDTLPSEIAAALAEADFYVPAGVERRRHRANLVRWHLLRTYGGVWADHDVIPLANLLRLARPFIAAHADGSVCTCILGMERGDPWATEALDAIEAAGASNRSTYASGDHLMEHVTPARVRRIPLPFDHEGRRVPAPMWAVHTFASTQEGT